MRNSGRKTFSISLLDALLHAVVRGVVVGTLEAEGRLVLDRLGARVGGHDQDHVAEVDVAAEAVGQPAFFHHLQQHVEHVGVGLLDFVEQHHRVRPAADLLGELAAFFVADVARRSADQAADVVLLHVLAHVDLHEGVLIAEHELGQRLGEQRFAHARRPGEDEGAGRPLGVLQAAAAAADGLGDAGDRLVLADDPLVQLVFHLHQPHASLRCSSASAECRSSCETTSAITSSSTTPSVSRLLSRHSRVICVFFFLSLSA